MFRKYILPLLAVVGIGFCIFMVYYGSKKPPLQPVLFPPPKPPYQSFVAGVGMIESIDKNISLGSVFSQIITDIYADIGCVVKKGDPIFKTDTRDLEAQLIQADAALIVAETQLQSAQIQFSFYQRLKDKSAASEQDYTAALYAMQTAEKQVELARTTVNVVKVNIERATTRAPIDGEILQSNIRIGEFANNTFGQTPMMLFGDTKFYHLRIDIDEEDAWRVIKGAPGMAFVRGNSNIAIPIVYAYYEPYIIPKQNLNGGDIQRVDTRVLQVVYKFERDHYPVYAGQLLDVYLEANSLEAAR